MANDKEINIGIKTEADTSGAEEIEKALDDVARKADVSNANPDAARELERLSQAHREETEAQKESILASFDKTLAQQEESRTAEVATAASAKGLAGKVQEIAKNKELIGTLAKVGGAYAVITAAAGASNKLIGDSLVKLEEAGANIDQLKEGNPESFAFFEAVKAVANPLGKVKELIGTIYEASLNGLLDLDSIREGKQQADAMAFQLERARTAIDDFAEAETSMRLTKLRKAGLLLSKENDELERRQRILDAERTRDAAAAKAADSERIAAGEAPELVRAERAKFDEVINTAKTQESLEKLEVAIAEAALKVQNAFEAEQEKKRAADALELDAKNADDTFKRTRLDVEIAKASGAVPEENLAAQREAQLALDTALASLEKGKQAVEGAEVDTRQAQAALEKAEADFATERTVIAAKIDQIRIETSAAIASETTALTERLKTDVTGEAEKLRDELGRIVSETGDSTAAFALDAVKKILTDSTPDSEQLAELGNIAAVAKASREAFNNAVLKGFQDQAVQYQSLKKQLDDLRSQVNERGALGGG